MNFNVSCASVAKIYSGFCKNRKIAKAKVGGTKPKKLSHNQKLFRRILYIKCIMKKT